MTNEQMAALIGEAHKHFGEVVWAVEVQLTNFFKPDLPYISAAPDGAVLLLSCLDDCGRLRESAQFKKRRGAWTIC